MGVLKSKQKSREELKSQIQEFNSRLQTALLGCQQAKVTFVTLSNMWCNSRREVLITLHSVADEIDRHHHNVNLASLAGTSSSIAGGTAAIGGLVLSPFTGGLSMALSAGGVAGSLAGSATTLGANITEAIITKELLERVKKDLDTDALYTNALSAAFRELIVHQNSVIEILSEVKSDALVTNLEKTLRSSPCSDEVKKRFFVRKPTTLEDMLALVKCLYSDDSEFLQQIDSTDRLLLHMPSLSARLSSSCEFFQAMKEMASFGPEVFTSIQGAAASGPGSQSLGAQVFGIGLGAVFIALDLYQFMKTSRNFDQGSKTELTKRLRDIAGDLSKEKEKVEKLSEFYRLQVNVDAVL